MLVNNVYILWYIYSGMPEPDFSGKMVGRWWDIAPCKDFKTRTRSSKIVLGVVLTPQKSTILRLIGDPGI